MIQAIKRNVLSNIDSCDAIDQDLSRTDAVDVVMDDGMVEELIREDNASSPMKDAPIPALSYDGGHPSPRMSDSVASIRLPTPVSDDLHNNHYGASSSRRSNASGIAAMIDDSHPSPSLKIAATIPSRPASAVTIDQPVRRSITTSSSTSSHRLENSTQLREMMQAMRNQIEVDYQSQQVSLSILAIDILIKIAIYSNVII
jgi:hypothetical protein